MHDEKLPLSSWHWKVLSASVEWKVKLELLLLE